MRNFLIIFYIFFILWLAYVFTEVKRKECVNPTTVIENGKTIHKCEYFKTVWEW